MAATQSFTGRYGTVTIAGATINITSWKATLRKEFADATDSGNYDAATTQVWTSQAPGVVGVDFTVEGNYDAGGSTDTNITQKFKTDGPYSVVLALTRSVNWATFNADFPQSDFSVSVPGSTMVTFSATGKSNGIVTLV